MVKLEMVEPAAVIEVQCFSTLSLVHFGLVYLEEPLRVSRLEELLQQHHHDSHVTLLDKRFELRVVDDSRQGHLLIIVHSKVDLF